MVSLVILVAGLIYLAILLKVTRASYHWARAKGYPTAKSVLVAAGGFLLIYLPVFWDHIPTILAHKYYCEKEVGFRLYKTLAQWQVENPGVTETLVADRSYGSSKVGNVTRHSINQRLAYAERTAPLFLSVRKREFTLVDVKTHETLAAYSAIEVGHGALALGGKDWRVLKFWLDLPPCRVGEADMFKLIAAARDLGER